jgi:hypothetical protein
MEQRDRPAEIEVTKAMIRAGVAALAQLVPMDETFPIGMEEDAVEAVLRAALEEARGIRSEPQASYPNPKANPSGRAHRASKIAT